MDWFRENIARSFLGFAACSQGKRGRFHTTTGLVTQLLEAWEERTLQRLHKQLERQDVNQCLAAPADSQRSLDPNPGWAIGPFVKLKHPVRLPSPAEGQQQFKEGNIGARRREHIRHRQRAAPGVVDTFRL